MSGVPTNLVVEGIPPVPVALKSDLARYLTLGGSTFRGWHSTKREMMVTLRVNDAVQLHSLKTPGGTRKALTRGTEAASSGSYRPVSADCLIYAHDQGGDENFQYYRLDLATQKVTRLTDGKSRNTGLIWSPDGRWIAYASTRRTGKFTDIYVMDPMNPASARMLWPAEELGWGISDWSPTGDKLLLRHAKSDTESSLFLADIQTGARQPVLKGGKRITYRGARFSERGAAIYATCDDDSNFQQLWRIDVATGERRSLTQNISWDVEDFEPSADGRTIAFVTNEDGYSALHLLDTASGRELPVPKLPGSRISGLEWHRKNREIAFTLGGAQFPNDAYSLDVDSGKIERWTGQTRKRTVTEPFREPELVKFKSFDGLEIPAFVYRPDPKKFPGKRPVVISIHGGPSSQSRPGFLGQNNYYLHELGVTLIYPNVRGSAGYGKKYLALDNGFKRENSVKDIGALIDWIKRDPSLDAARIAVMGGSYGGFMSLASMIAYHDDLRCGIDIVGISNFVTFLHDTSEYRRDNRRQEYGDERDAKMRAFQEKISPANRAGEITRPMFIVQGRNDPRVPYTEAVQMVKAIRSKGGTAWFLMANDEGHGFNKKRNVDYQFQATILFLKEHLLK